MAHTWVMATAHQKVCQIQIRRPHAKLFSFPNVKFVKRNSQICERFPAPLEWTMSLCFISCASAKLRSGNSCWKRPLVSLFPVKKGSRLRLHGVLDAPSLASAGLQDHQVAEVSFSGHHLQTASRGSIYDRVILRGGRRERVMVLIHAKWPRVHSCFRISSKTTWY